MNELQLSNRLKIVYDNIDGSRFADIGSDHAYLPCYAVYHGKVDFAIAGEVNDGPFQTALLQVIASGLSSSISVRKGDGLEVVGAGEVDCVTIAGMGGKLIAQILDEGKAKLTGVSRLVLQPNVGSIHVRNWLIDHDWTLVCEHIIEEDGKIYEVLVAVPGLGQLNEVERLMGPFLLKQREKVFVKKWIEERDKLLQVLEQIKLAQDEKNVLEKLAEIKYRITLIEEGLSI